MGEESNINAPASAHTLFRRILNGQQIRSLANFRNPKELSELSKELGTLFHRKVGRKPNQVLICLANYHRLIVSVKDHQLINNISLHFILLSSYNMLQNGERSAARGLLKKSVGYISSTNPDPILLATALNNLCLLLMGRGKYNKSLSPLMASIEVMEAHLREIKKSSEQNKRQRIMEDTVVLVNCYLNASLCLGNIMHKNHAEFYVRLLKHINDCGLKRTIKYLGRGSYFTTKFMKVIDQQNAAHPHLLMLELPVYIGPSNERQDTHTSQKIIEKLSRLQEIILAQQLQPKIVEVPRVEPKPPIYSSRKVVYNTLFTVNNWQVQVEILKEKQEEKIGTLVLNCHKGDEHIHLIIPEPRILRIMSQMNLYDFLPYQCHANDLTSQEFIKYVVKTHLGVDDNKNIQIYPRSTGVFQPLIRSVFGLQQVIFINHIEFNQFRLVFCPLDSSQTYRLDVMLAVSFVQSVIELVEQTNKNIQKICTGLQRVARSKSGEGYVQKVLRLKDEPRFVKTMMQIIDNFELFMSGMNAESEGTVLSDHNHYYQFKQNHNNVQQGKFFLIKYVNESRHLQIYAHNTYPSYRLNGNEKSKGSATYTLAQLSQDLGVLEANLRACFLSGSYIRFELIAKIISLKYDLQTYENPLTTIDKQQFLQNSIKQAKIVFKTFFRKVVRFHEYVIPLTICVVSINNEIPVGLKISTYEPLSCKEVGYFIYVEAQAWRRPADLKHKIKSDNVIVRVIEEYPYKKQYYLVEWLQKSGFKAIAAQIKINEKGGLQMSQLVPCCSRIARVLDIIKL